MIRPIFLCMRLTDVLKTNPYAKYMKDIITNKRKIQEAEISTMLANYTFKGCACCGCECYYFNGLCYT